MKNHPSPEEIKNKLIFETPQPVQDVVDNYKSVMNELEDLKHLIKDNIGTINMDEMNKEITKIKLMRVMERINGFLLVT